MPLPVIDQHSTATHTGGTGATISVSTAGNDRTVFLFVEVGTTGGAITTTVSGGGLTWSLRTSVVNTSLAYARTEIWSAPAPTQLTAATITVTTSGTMDDMALIAVSYTLANAAIFDTNGGLPANSTTSTTGTISLTVSTSEGDDVVFGVVGSNSEATIPSPVSPFLSIVGVATSGGTHFAMIYVQRDSFTGPQTGLAVSANVATSAHAYTYIVDAISGFTPGGTSNFFFCS